jgi:hypothetical protein
MAEVRAAWNETGDKLTELGRKLKVHYDAQHGGEHEQTRQELVDAARRLGSAVQDAFEAIGTAARDKAVQDDVKQVGQSLAEALGATLGQATEEVRRAFSERKGPAATRPAAPDAPEAGAAPPAAEETAGEQPEETAGEQPGETAGEQPGENPPKVEPWGTP